MSIYIDIVPIIENIYIDVVVSDPVYVDVVIGESGSNDSGSDGREIELQNNGTHIQWRYVGDVSWNNMVALSAITGQAGNDGNDGREVELQNNGTYIQWRYLGEVAWNNLVALSAITGPAGDDGNDGREVELQNNGTYIQWRYVGGVSWNNLVALSAITGPAGADAYAAMRLLNDFSTTNTTATDTNLKFAIAANEKYEVIITGTAIKSGNSAGLKLAIGAPTGCTVRGFQQSGGSVASTAPSTSYITAINSLGTTFGTGDGVEVLFRIEISIANGSNAGFITLQAASVTSGTTTIKARSRMMVFKSTDV